MDYWTRHFNEHGKRSAWYLEECLASLSLSCLPCLQISFKKQVKKKKITSLWRSVLQFLPLASPLFCLTLSPHCLTWDQLDGLRQACTGVGLIWSKLCTSGWVVVLWPCLCWMSAPCLSWEQPTGIPQIWHAAPHTRREREEGKKEKKNTVPQESWLNILQRNKN